VLRGVPEDRSHAESQGFQAIAKISLGSQVIQFVYGLARGFVDEIRKIFVVHRDLWPMGVKSSGVKSAGR
jgi:hypothetical protein